VASSAECPEPALHRPQPRARTGLGCDQPALRALAV